MSKRYKCKKEMVIECYDEDGFLIEDERMTVEVGSIWEETNNMIIGGTNNIHLDRIDGTGNWCEPLKENLLKYFELIG